MPRFSPPVPRVALTLSALALALLAHRWLPTATAQAPAAQAQAPAAQAQPPAAQEPAPAIRATPSPAEQAHADLHARYAEARLRLARANLAQAEHLAQTAPHQVNDLELASLRRRVAVLERHAIATRERPHGHGFELARSAIESAALQADKELAAARAANDQRPGTVSETTLGQLEAAADLARARLAIWNDPSFAETPLKRMEMQIDQLEDEVFELIQRLDSRFSNDRR